ncbi:MAG: 16S rRNA (cytosine(1402)-N(4))-methyltransferase RsmH [Lentisphaerae bacterium]|nr:16S rRNA (cytosine(1402)-N(4))-methyltransferase RsmH [Lentisphaerota bacterium]
MHTPVMVREVVDLLGLRPGGAYVDGTVGSGGHARAFLEQLGPQGCLLAVDRDERAIAVARETLASFSAQCRFAQGNFADIKQLAEQHGLKSVDGVLLDLGMSALQVEEAERGFSFLKDGPLDMRMDLRQGLRAADLVNTLGEEALAELIRSLSDEPAARGIARAIVRERQRRPIKTTGQLADLVVRVRGGRWGRLHPATRTFQALRMAVNRELESLAEALEGAIALLKPGGRLAVLSYHSLEDRLVKRIAREHIGRWVSLASGGERWEGTPPQVRWITPKPLKAAPEEISRNPRSRSAKLRVMERINSSHG